MDENIREEILQENKMGTMPVGRLLFSMAVPMMVSMLFQALYNVVDSIFVAKLSQDAMNAVSLAFPLQTLCIAFSGGTGVGMNALLSRSLGEKNQAGADRAANVGLFLTLCNFVLFALIGWTLAGPFFRFQTDNPQIIAYGRDYVTVCIGCSIGLFFQMYNERLLQSTGRTNLSMITQIAGAATNIVLDPILIFGLLIYFGLKLFARFRRAPSPVGAGQGPAAADEPFRREGADGWGALRSTAAATGGTTEDAPPVSVPQGFDVEEFLRGAKMAYNRLQQAWDKRDMADIAQFATQAVQEEVRRQMEADPTSGSTELLLVNAHLLGVENDGPDQYAQVFFDVLLREDPAQQAPTSVREVWHFVRPVAGGMWKLDGIQQVEG